MNSGDPEIKCSAEEELRMYKDTELAFESLAASVSLGIPSQIFGKYRECSEHLQKLILAETNPTFVDALREVHCSIEMQQIQCKSTYCQGSYPRGEPTGEVRKCKKMKVEKQTAAESSRKEALLSTVRSFHGGTLLLRDIAGLDHVKSVLRNYNPSGKRKTWNHILLYGPPGTGKSKIASAIASESQLTLFSITSADLLSSWVGESEKTIKDLFEMARSVEKTSIVFIDEIDSVCRKRNDSEADYSRRVKNQLLIELDNNLSGKKSCVLLCATNCPWDLDAAFVRRFQCRLYVPLPDESARLQILHDQCKGVGVVMSEEDWKCIVKHTEGYSGADLTNLAMYAVQEPIGELEFKPLGAQRYESRDQPSSSSQITSSRDAIPTVPLDQMEIRDVKLHDFIKALHATSKSVTPAQLQKFQSFMEHSG